MYFTVGNLTKSYEDFSLAADFSCEKGEIVSILGPSGSGKSTLLRILAGLIKPDSGYIELDGRAISHLPPQKRSIGMVFQDYALFGHLSVADNIAYGLKMSHKTQDFIEKKVNELLGRFSLDGYGPRSIRTLSGGEKQRVALARSVAVSPGLMLFDEPLGSLDASLRKELRQELRLLQRELGYTSITVTHDQDDALAVSDRVIIMNQGRILQNDSPENLWNYPADSFVASFVGDGTSLRVESLEGSTRGLPVVRTALGVFSLAVDEYEKRHQGLAGEEQRLFFRAEKVQILGGHGDDSKVESTGLSNCFTAQVEDSEYLGRTYRVRLSSGSTVIHGHSTTRLKPGTHLILRVAPEDFRLL